MSKSELVHYTALQCPLGNINDILRESTWQVDNLFTISILEHLPSTFLWKHFWQSDMNMHLNNFPHAESNYKKIP